jgi:hypothetical protein
MTRASIARSFETLIVAVTALQGWRKNESPVLPKDRVCVQAETGAPRHSETEPAFEWSCTASSASAFDRGLALQAVTGLAPDP